MRRETIGSGNILACNRHGRISGIADQPADQANRAVVVPDRYPPKEVDWNGFRASLGHMSRELLGASAISMAVR